MSKIPNWKLYKECRQCGEWSFGQRDAFCSRCGTKLQDREEPLAGINDYAKTLLVDLLENHAHIALDAYIGDIPGYATEGIRTNGNVLFNQAAARRVIAECWNEIERALENWRETTGSDVPIQNAEQLHVFSVAQHAEMVWREITADYPDEFLNEEGIEELLEKLKRV